MAGVFGVHHREIDPQPLAEIKQICCHCIAASAGNSNFKRHRTTQERARYGSRPSPQRAEVPYFRRMCSRTDKPKAVTAAAHKLARLIYTMLTKGEEYTNQSRDYYEERYRERVLRALAQRAAKLGMQILSIAQSAWKILYKSIAWEGFLRGFAALCSDLFPYRDHPLNVLECRQGLQVVVGLHDQPRSGITTEVLSQARCRVGRDSAPFLDDFVNARRWNT